MKNKPGIIMDKNGELLKYKNGKYIYTCNYKNCRLPAKEGWEVCEKHIGQNKKDFEKNHFTMGNIVFKCDKKTAKIINSKKLKFEKGEI